MVLIPAGLGLGFGKHELLLLVSDIHQADLTKTKTRNTR